jgi:ribonuclease HII
VPLLVGIDEAGYGPTLGPLVVGATLWRVQPGCLQADFWKLLRECVARRRRRSADGNAPGSRARGRRSPPGGSRLTVGDSKAVFNRKSGLHSLERPVLAFASAAGVKCDSLAGLLEGLGARPGLAETEIPWYSDLRRRLPVDPVRSKFQSVAERLESRLPAVGIAGCNLMAQVVSEDRFNHRVASTRNKAAVLLEQVLCLLQRAGEVAGDSDMHVLVDRLGGRVNYQSLLLAAFPERHLHVLEVSGGRSRYRLASAHNDWHLEFAVDADQQHLPVALASMLAKYVRELLMERFNEYWRRWLPDLCPTAGYYTDARRFLGDIRAVVAQAGIPAEHFVRSR